MRRTVAYLLAAAAPSLGWAAVSVPRTVDDMLAVIVAGFFIVLLGTALPRGLGLFVVAWWMLTVWVFAWSWVPWLTGLAHVGPWHVGHAPTAVVKPLSVFLACAWWSVAFGPALVAWFGKEPAPEPAVEETPKRRSVPDLTRALQPPSDAPIAPRRVVTLGPDRYADVTIDGPDDDSSGPLSFLDEVAALFPDRRRTDTGKVSVKDIAERLGLDRSEVVERLSEEGVETARMHGVTPLDGGPGSSQRAVSWAALGAAGCAMACARP